MRIVRTSRNTCNRSSIHQTWRLVVFAILSLLLGLTDMSVVEALPKLKPLSVRGGGASASSSSSSSSGRGFPRLHFPLFNKAETIDDELRAIDTFTDTSISLITLCYGISMVAFSHFFPGQIHVMTMMRATGFEKIEKGIVAARQNFRDALRAAIFNAPSLLLMRKSVKSLSTRMESAKKVKEETKKAAADGIIDKDEARKIAKMKNRQMRAVQRDMKRLQRGASSLGRVIEALDIDEIKDIAKGFMFIITAVLASGRSESTIGTVISRYCHWLNLGSLMLDVNRKIGFPLSRLILLRDWDIFDDDLEPEERAKMRNFGTGIMYSLSGYLLMFQNEFGEQLNDSLIASALTVRGLAALTGVTELAVARKAGFGLGEHEEDIFVRRRMGGFLMLTLTTIGMKCTRMAKAGKIKLPHWMQPLQTFENGLEKFVDMAAGK